MNLYDRRIALGLSAEELGRRVDLSGDTIRNLEKGARPHTETALKLVNYFSQQTGNQIPASELFPREPEAA